MVIYAATAKCTVTIVDEAVSKVWPVTEQDGWAGVPCVLAFENWSRRFGGGGGGGGGAGADFSGDLDLSCMYAPELTNLPDKPFPEFLRVRQWNSTPAFVLSADAAAYI